MGGEGVRGAVRGSVPSGPRMAVSAGGGPGAPPGSRYGGVRARLSPDGV